MASAELGQLQQYKSTIAAFFMEPPQTTGANRRVSLTKTQRETAIGVEFLSLCQTITADGSMSDEELQMLRGWLSTLYLTS